MFRTPIPLGILTAGIILAVDQWSKNYLMPLLLEPPTRLMITDFFHLTPVWNHGVSFGLFKAGSQGEVYAILGVTTIITLLVISWLRQATTRLAGISLGLILGGAIGNIIDRLLYGAVFDFLDVNIGSYHWPAFNVADSAICVGVGLYLYASWCTSRANSQSTGGTP